MITQKILFNKETVKRQLPLNFNVKDMALFRNELRRILGKSYLFDLRNVKIFSDGSIYPFNFKIIDNQLGFKSISSHKFLKKIFLLIIFVKNLFLNILNYKLLNPKKKFLNNVVIIHDRNSEGYFHWINDILPKLLIIEKTKKLSNSTIILPNKLKKKFIVESLKYFSLNYFFIDKNEIVIAKSCKYISDISNSGNPRPEMIKKLRKKFRKLKLKKKNNYKKIYISRRFSRRRLSNEKKIEDFLKSKNYKIIYMENQSFSNQIKICANAKILIGPYGAGLINCIWQKKGSKVLEIRPNNEYNANCFFAAANALELKYYYVKSIKENLFKSTKTSNYYLNLENLKKCLKKIKKNDNN